MEKSKFVPKPAFSRFAFYFWVFIAVFVLMVLEMSLVIWISVRLGHPEIDAGHSILALNVLNWPLALVGVDRILKWFGHSWSGNSREFQSRMLVQPEGNVEDHEVVEVNCRKSDTYVLILISLFIWLGSVSLLIFTPSWGTRDLIIGIDGLAFGAMGLLSWSARNECRVRANFQGIFGLPLGFHFRRKFVPWSEIETCEIVTHHNTFGDRILIQPVFKDRLGKELLNLDLRFLKSTDQDRLVKYIKAKLPKAPFEPFEL
jgi:hypothetical protein